MTFQLDTNGFVGLNLDGKVDPDWMNETAWTFADLNAFTQGYIEAMFAGAAQDGGSILMTLGAFYGFSALAPETLSRIIADCEANTRNMVETFSDTAHRHAGGQFWTMRQEDRAGRFPPLTIQLGDDGKVRFG